MTLTLALLRFRNIKPGLFKSGFNYVGFYMICIRNAFLTEIYTLKSISGRLQSNETFCQCDPYPAPRIVHRYFSCGIITMKKLLLRWCYMSNLISLIVHSGCLYQFNFFSLFRLLFGKIPPHKGTVLCCRYRQSLFSQSGQ